MNIYKYTTVSSAKLILKNLQLRFTPPCEFNDSLEVSPHIASIASQNFFSSVLRGEYPNHPGIDVNGILANEYSKLSDDQKALLSFDGLRALYASPGFQSIVDPIMNGVMGLVADIMNKVIPDGISQAIGALCVTTDIFSELMWAHYGDSHRGVAIVFFEKHGFFQQEGHPRSSIRSLRDVIYQRERPKFHDLLNMNREQIQSFNFEEATVFTKSDVWTYEKEKRCTRFLTEANQTATVGGQKVYLFDFPSDCLQGVAFGARCSIKDQLDVLDILDDINTRTGQNLVAMQMQPHKSEYALTLPYYRRPDRRAQ